MSRTFASIGLVQVCVMLAALFRTKILSLLLGPEGVGVVGTLDQAMITLAQAAAFGLPFTALKFMARGHSESHAAYQASYASFLRLLAGLSLAVVASVLGVMWLVPGLIPSGLAPYRVPLAFALLGAPVFTLNILFVNATAAARRSSGAAWLALVQALVLSGSAVVGAAVGGIRGLYGASFVCGILGVLATAWWLSARHDLSPVARPGDTVRQLQRHPEIVRYALLVQLTLVAFAATMFATRYLALITLGEEPTGRMQAQLSVALTIGAVLAPLTNLYLTPLLNRTSPTAEKTSAADGFARTAALLFAMGALPIVLFPALTLRILYSGSFTAGAAVVSAFVLWQLAFQLTSVFQQLLLGLDDVAYCSGSTIAGMLVAVVLCVPLVRAFGGLGVAAALLAGALVQGAAFGARLAARFAYTPSRAVLGRAVAAGALVLGGALVQLGPSEGTVAGVGLRIAAAAASLLFLFVLTTPDERLRVRGLLPGARVRPAVPAR